MELQAGGGTSEKDFRVVLPVLDGHAGSDSCSEIWFVFPTKKSGEKCISYNDAVEEALCFGWIDGRAGTLDENHNIRRFTPRKKQ